MIPITTGSGFVTAIDSDPCPGPAFDLPQQPPWLPFLRRLRHRAIQLPTFGDLPRRQVQPQFDDFGLGFCLALSSLLFLLIHRADNVAAGAAACRLMSSSRVVTAKINGRCFTTVSTGCSAHFEASFASLAE